jgi:hypothetical protein
MIGEVHLEPNLLELDTQPTILIILSSDSQSFEPP